MNSKLTWILTALMLVQSLPRPTYGGGFNIASKFADVIMEHIQPGKLYNLRTMQNLPYRVYNNGDIPMDLVVEVQIPEKGGLKPGYENIPDPSWVRMVPNKMRLAPGEQGLVDIILQVPDEPKYVGHHFQAHLICRTPEPPPGENLSLSFQVALQSRLRFSVGSEGPEEIRRLQKKGIYQMLNFTLEPDLQYVPGEIVPGKTYQLSQEFGIRLTLINRSPQTLKFKLVPVAAPGGMSAPSHYEFGDPSWVKVKTPEVVLAGESLKGSDIELLIPDKPEFRGKRFTFVFQAGLQERDIPVEVFARVNVTVAK